MTIHILPNTSQSNGNQTMEFGHVIEYNKRSIFLQKSCNKKAGRIVPDLVLFFNKTVYQDCEVINFEINLNLSNLAVFQHDQEFKTKI